MRNEIGRWDRETASVGKCCRHRFVPYEANGTRVIDGQDTRRLSRLKDDQARAIRDRFEHVGIVAI